MTEFASLLTGLSFRVALPADLPHAKALQRQVYEEDVAHVPSDDYDDLATYFVVVNEAGDYVATFRLVGPDQRPLDVERLVDLRPLLGADRTPAVVGRLCIRRDHRTVSRRMMIPYGLLKLAFDYSAIHGITDLFLYTYPHLLGLYRAAFFRELVPAVAHPAWGEVHVMHLDLVDLRLRFAASHQPLARFLFRKGLPNFAV